MRSRINNKQAQSKVIKKKQKVADRSHPAGGEKPTFITDSILPLGAPLGWLFVVFLYFVRFWMNTRGSRPCLQIQSTVAVRPSSEEHALAPTSVRKKHNRKFRYTFGAQNLLRTKKNKFWPFVVYTLTKKNFISSINTLNGGIFVRVDEAKNSEFN